MLYFVLWLQFFTYVTLTSLMGVNQIPLNPKDDQSRLHLETAAELFMRYKTTLGDSFFTRVIVTHGESIKKCLDPAVAAVCRDAFVKIVYLHVFDWLVSKINKTIGQDADSKFFIGVLDIYGYENF